MPKFDIEPWLHPALLPLLGEVQEQAQALLDAVQTEPYELPGIGSTIRKLHDIGMCTYHNQARTVSATQVPLLSNSACELILACTADSQYKVNDAEDAAYQMQELVLSRAGFSLLHGQLEHIHNEVIRPLWILLYGLYPETINSIQMARYLPGETARTNWHFDQDSDCTTTVSLNSDYKGGGMDLFPDDSLPASPRGMATLFRGSSTLHRSRPVTSGKRDLLVYWVDQR